MAKNSKWSAWLAALGGLVSIIGLYVGATSLWVWIGGLSAIIFGVWAAYQ